MRMDLAQAISDYGFPIIAAMGLGYFVYYVWQWVTKEIDPVLGDASKTLIGLIDRVRMLDNDLIRLKTKLDLILEQQEKEKNEKEKEHNTTNNRTSIAKSGNRK